MTLDPTVIWPLAEQVAEKAGATALAALGAKGLAKGGAAIWTWLRGTLPASAHPTIDALEAKPDSKPAKAALAVAVNAELEARPALIADLRALLAEAGDAISATQTVGDNSRAGQAIGQSNTISISG